MNKEERLPLLGGNPEACSKENPGKPLRLKRHITLFGAVLIMVGNVIGSGIFLSPKGVIENSGSVGASLIIWTATGVYNLAQALCYAELGTIIPRAGGDYSYIYEVFGPWPAFMCAWIHVVVIASSSCAVIARTAGLYLLQPLSLDCDVGNITLLAVFIIVTLAAINAISSVWGARAMGLFTICKFLALGVVIIAGIVQLIQGQTGNFRNSFDGTATNPGPLAIAVLDGYFAYKGWELLNALPEEMVNPERDLGPTVWISMTLVTAAYVLTNVAYFSVLSPTGLLQSDAVALTFTEKAIGSNFIWIMSIFVALSCMGAVNGDFLSNSRYVLAGGRYKQVPRVFSYIHVERSTPVLAVILLMVFPLMYAIFTDLQVIQEYASLTVQFKMILTLSALFYLRWKQPDIPRPYKVNTVVSIVTFLLMLALVALSFYQSPFTSLAGVGVFALGVPFYGAILFARKFSVNNKTSNAITAGLQCIFLVAPDGLSDYRSVLKNPRATE
ncbi:hypothetical protein CAPTEDRAFT_170083 [Capitella teleta]|uniref:Amino acid permease/ SLC12A domain-containing protein n=1 Tax=Capitella teleta TaxID=283909 RepID=R7VJM2_CAPTE|nr:hypothetical protein CAPTEDRAFT_170083 [Capitella teleta]|eukprot:ELU16601.1 hypothetical protein CAPTEDRAFT_170083 [Capitella teleta]